jgi:hypothetical protein
VDFTDFHFTRHLLSCLHHVDADRFSVVRQELRIAWLSRMRTFLDCIGSSVMLLWLAPDLKDLEADDAGLGPDPLFLSEDLMSELRPLVRETVVVPVRAASAVSSQTADSVHGIVASALLQPILTALHAGHNVLSLPVGGSLDRSVWRESDGGRLAQVTTAGQS